MQLLAEDPSLKRFKSHKKSVRMVKKVGDVLTVVVVAGNAHAFDFRKFTCHSILSLFVIFFFNCCLEACIQYFIEFRTRILDSSFQKMY